MQMTKFRVNVGEPFDVKNVTIDSQNTAYTQEKIIAEMNRGLIAKGILIFSAVVFVSALFLGYLDGSFDEAHDVYDGAAVIVAVILTRYFS